MWRVSGCRLMGYYCLVFDVMDKVIMYTTNQCLYCKAAKKFFEEHQVVYEERNVTEDTKYREELFALGVRQVPVFVYKDKVEVGFDESRMKEFLA